MNLYQYLTSFNFSFSSTLIGQPLTPMIPQDWDKAYHVDQLKIMRSDFSTEEWAHLLKAARFWDKGTNQGDMYLSLLISAIKRSYLWKTVFHGCNSFVIIKDPTSGQRISIETQPDCILFKDFNMYGYNEKKVHVNKTLYHTSHIPNIKNLYPSIGARNPEHSIYDTPRIYCTTTPTSAGGWPLLIGLESELAVKSIQGMIQRGEKDNAIKYISKWVAKSETLHIYELPRVSAPLYPDHEVHQSFDKEGMVFYIKTDKAIPVKEINSLSRKVDFNYLKDKPILKEFIKENLISIKQEIKTRLSEYKNKNYKIIR